MLTDDDQFVRSVEQLIRLLPRLWFIRDIGPNKSSDVDRPSQADRTNEAPVLFWISSDYASRLRRLIVDIDSFATHCVFRYINIDASP